MIPLSIPNFEGNEKEYVLKAISEGWVSTGGAYINEFENKLADYLKAPNMVACQSGTSAIHLALIDCGVTNNDLVIVPALTFIAAVNPVRYQGAEPIFMDCDDSLCMDPYKLEQFCKQECILENNKLRHKATNKTVKAIIVVHVFGNIADMEKILSIAHKYNLKIIEDATEALGSYYISGPLKLKYAGTIGDYGCYSFNGNKIITTGGGGAITTNTANSNHLKYLSTQAKDDTLFYTHNEIGYNYRMTNLQAALGVAQLEKLSEYIDRKNRNYNKYQSMLSDIKQIELLKFRETIYSNKWFYSIKINTNTVNLTIAEIIDTLKQKGIQSRPLWGLINKQKPYINSIAYNINKAETYSKSIINIPCSTNLTDQEIEKVVSALSEIF